MSAKKMVFKAAAVVVVLAVVSFADSVAGADQVGAGRGASGLAGVYDNGTFRFEIGALTGQGTNPKVCVTVASKSSDRRAQGCGPVSMAIHPTLEVAMVHGTVQGQLVQTSTGRVLNKAVPISIDLTYQGIGMYQPFVTSASSELWLYPLDVAAAQGAGVSRAAWGWGSVKAPVCKPSTAAARRNRTTRAATMVCGPSSDAPAFAGTIAQTVVASAGVAS
jgi:hypothetical protein